MVGAMLLTAMAVRHAVGVARYEELRFQSPEPDLADWRPADSYIKPPGTACNDPEKLNGWWLSPDSRAVSNFVIRPSGDGTFKATFRTGGSLGGWKQFRTARLNAGVVYLDKPVQSYLGDTYDRLFFVEIDRVLTLVPAGLMEDTATSLSFRLKNQTLTKWPKPGAEARDYAGVYVTRWGFGNVTLEMGIDGSVTATHRFDHPGEGIWTGTWQFDKEGTRLTSTQKFSQEEDGRVVTFTWAPVVWGDRLYLVDEADLKDGAAGRRFARDAERLNEQGERDRMEMGWTHYFVRVKTGQDALPHRYGKIVAPKKYQDQFNGIDLKLPK